MTDTNRENLTYEYLPEDYPNYDITFKIIVIGDSFVGKSCLTTRGTKNSYDDSYNATVGFEFVTSNIKINDKVCKMQIWDTCGQEVYRSLITNFYRNSSLAILVYSIDNQESFDNLDLWLKELKTFSSPDAKIFLIGNKSDLESKRVITKEMGEKFKEDTGIDFFLETSAKLGINTNTVFIEAAKILYLDYLKYKDKISYSRTSSVSSNVRSETIKQQIKIDSNTSKEDKNKCNC
jgi:small GTP-binding protein